MKYTSSILELNNSQVSGKKWDNFLTRLGRQLFFGQAQSAGLHHHRLATAFVVVGVNTGLVKGAGLQVSDAEAWYWRRQIGTQVLAVALAHLQQEGLRQATVEALSASHGERIGRRVRGRAIVNHVWPACHG